MSKPKILINRQDHVTFHNDYLRPQLAQYFDIVDYDPTVNYDSWLYSAMTNGVTQNTWHESLVQSGAGLIYDNLWEYHLAAQKRSCVPSTAHVASCKSYFWINEHYSNIAHGYNQYVPDKNPTHLALLPVRRLTPQRRQLLTALTPVLSQIIYSTVDQGRFLPQDQNETMGSFDRYFDPNWYNNTCFSIVSETTTYTKYQLHVTLRKIQSPGWKKLLKTSCNLNHEIMTIWPGKNSNTIMTYFTIKLVLNRSLWQGLSIPY